MKVLLPFAKNLCNPDKMILDIDVPEHYDMYQALKSGNFWNWEREVLAMLLSLTSTTKSANFLDIGANIGVYSLVICALFSNTIPVAAIEANPELTKNIQMLAERNNANINIYPYAITATKDKYVKFNISFGNSGSSLNSLGSYTRDIIQVKSVALADIYNGFNIIKIDTEGTEYDALSSGMVELASFRPAIIAEILNEKNFSEIYKLTQNLSYKIYHLKKDFSIKEIEKYPRMRAQGEYNFLLAPHAIDGELMAAHSAWSQAIYETGSFSTGATSINQADNRLFFEFLRYNLNDLNNFTFYPIGRSFLALYPSDLTQDIHYEFLIIQEYMTINLHFETRDCAFNKQMRDLVLKYFKQHTLLIDIKIYITDPPQICGFNIRYRYQKDYKAALLYVNTMRQFIFETRKFLSDTYCTLGGLKTRATS